MSDDSIFADLLGVRFCRLCGCNFKLCFFVENENCNKLCGVSCFQLDACAELGNDDVKSKYSWRKKYFFKVGL